MARASNFLILLAFFNFLAGCSLGIRLPAAGLAGKYGMGRSLLMKNQDEAVTEAISYLEQVAKKDPTYKDTLTLLGRGYYYKQRYKEALWVFGKALEIDKKDEIAWIALSLTQLRLGEDGRGLDSLQTGLALLSRASKSGYRDYLTWDLRGVVRSSIRKTIIQVASQGLNGKDRIIRSAEILLVRVDNEELAQRGDKSVEDWMQLGDQ